MSDAKLSALVSLGAAAAIVVATFFQWWTLLWDGGMRLRWWVRILLGVVLVALGFAAFLLLR